MKKVQQRTADDCMVACLAMLLDEEYGEVIEWFTSKGRQWNTLQGLVVTLVEKGYEVRFAGASGIGRWGGIRRLVTSVNDKDEGHAFVIDENESVCDPSHETPNSFDISKLSGRLAGLGHRVECVARIERLEERRPCVWRSNEEKGFHAHRAFGQ